MRAFIYDKYGYYPDEENVTSFTYNGWFYKLEISEKNDQEIHSLRLLLEEINRNFTEVGTDIIRARDGHYVTMSNYGPVVLVAVKEGKVNIDLLIKIHFLFINRFDNVRLKISHLRSLWINKIETIKERILPLLEKDNFDAYVLSQYALSMAENALAYLLDTIYIYGDEVIIKTLVHKRIEEFDSFYLFNPFNLIIDSPTRDFSFLYKGGFISLEKLNIIMDNYNFKGQEASLLLARSMYPDYIFDIIEDYYELKKDIKQKAKNSLVNLDNHIFKLKKLHNLLIKKYSIKPISFLK